MNQNGRRRAGVLIPLFACPSSTSWGIGDIGDVTTITRWLAGAGQRVLQLLPINEMASGQQSPYSAMSAMAIDPIFIRVNDVAEFGAIGGEQSLSRDDRARLARVREAPHVDYPIVRALKQRALTSAFEHFEEHEWCRDTARARRLTAYVDAERWWIDDYALFRALHEREDGRAWTEWPAPLRSRDPQALAQARQELADEILFRQYLQWIADEQWRAPAQRRANSASQLFGDLPFMVDGDSADVWAHQSEFRLDASVGVPPDAFSATGQDWGMPAYRWDAIAQQDFRWLRDRARRSAALYDGYRIDHLVGFYRTYSRPRNGGVPSFEPATEPEQQQLGERLMTVFREPGAEDVLRKTWASFPTSSATRSPNCKSPAFGCSDGNAIGASTVSRSAIPFGYPALSVATSGTHDTEPMAIWWDEAPDTEKQMIAKLPGVQQAAGSTLLAAPFNPTVRDAILETLFAIGIEPIAYARAGFVRLARSHQRAGDGRREELDVSIAVGERPSRRPAGSAGKKEQAA